MKCKIKFIVNLQENVTEEFNTLTQYYKFANDMNDIKIFVVKEKRIRMPSTNYENIQRRYRSVIWNWKMHHAYYEYRKRKKENNVSYSTTKSRKHQNTSRKR